ncbi:MAG: 4Fe-4S dicluster domain-containing protein [Anaerolineae bacterium]|nr:4Fe-4S dicluster domain-containing protein [Anaerolineae bacterium]
MAQNTPPIPPAAAYTRLVERLNRFPQGAPPSPSLYEILSILFSEREAALVAQLPIQSFALKDAARIWQVDESAAQKTLDDLTSRALIIDVAHPDGRIMYSVPPPMAGFFEFSMMRLRDDVDQKRLAELYYQYLNVEDDFLTDLFGTGGTNLGRILINEQVIPSGVEVLDYERASEVVNTASHIGISQCYCRFKMQMVEEACAAPLDVCMTFNATAEGLIKSGYARQVDVAEGMDVLQTAYDHNLVQFGDNARRDMNFICNCCGCCCEALTAARRFETMNPLHTTNFIAAIDLDKCSGCGKCVNICPVEAMTLVSANDPTQPKRKQARLNEDICLGCGVCARVCDSDGITMQPREQRVFTPLTFAHRVVLTATERGQLQDLIFDRRDQWSQRTLAAILGAILRLPPVKRTLARQQVRSRFLEAWIDKVGNARSPRPPLK